MKKVLIALAVVVVLFVIVVATRPSETHIERSGTMNARPEIAFAQINDFHKWTAWSPWEALDPNMKRTHEGSAEGTGAIYSWAGNDEVGEGRMTILESKPPEKIVIKLEFIKPFAQTSETIFTVTKEGEGSKVKWEMNMKNGFLSKMAGMFMNLDKQVGGDFEKGLASMKNVAETEEAKKKEEDKKIAEAGVNVGGVNVDVGIGREAAPAEGAPPAENKAGAVQ